MPGRIRGDSHGIARWMASGARLAHRQVLPGGSFVRVEGGVADDHRRMTAIDRLGGAGRPAAVGRGRRTQSAAAGFALPATAAATGGAETIGEATPASLLGAMLALQEVAPRRERDQVARHHGEAILTALTALQVGLLGGAVCGKEFGHLARLAAQLPEAADPVLGMLVRAVALRAEVELARGAAADE